jgi:hypothetical protein
MIEIDAVDHLGQPIFRPRRWPAPEPKELRKYAFALAWLSC